MSEQARDTMQTMSPADAAVRKTGDGFDATGRVTARARARRGLLAGAAALTVAAVGKLAAPDRAEAGHDTTTAPTNTNVLHLGVINDGGNAANSEAVSSVTSTTVLVASADGPAFRARNLRTGATGNDGAIEAISGNGAGVRGVSLKLGNGTGVIGQCDSGTGVSGITTSGVGMSGNSTEGTGVRGIAGTVIPTPLRGVGVHGEAATGTGVRGQSRDSFGLFGASASGTGAFGGSDTGIGVYANSNADTGLFSTAPAKAVWGRTTTGIGVFGQATGNGTGVYGAAPAPGGFAGFFEGNVVVQGAFAVVGGPKNALVAHPDGSYRRMYCQESPEAMFEDFGTAKLVNGRAEVKLDPDFAAVVENGAYLVYVTPLGDSRGLYVASRSATSFEVREQQGGTTTLEFAYRIVAKRKDLQNGRLEKVQRETVERARKLAPANFAPPRLPELPDNMPGRGERGPETRPEPSPAPRPREDAR